MNNLFGIRVFESPLCSLPVPVREHKKTRHTTEAYHRRVQKKWNKRYGTKLAPAAFIVSGATFGMPHMDGLFAHPEYIAIIKNLQERK